MFWRQAVLNALYRYTYRHNSDLINRQLFVQEEIDLIIQDTDAQGQTPTQTLSRVLQELRDEGILEFHEPGIYLLVDNKAERERGHRRNLWNQLIQLGGPHNVSPQHIRNLGIYSGQQGIYIDKSRTCSISETGVTVSVLHTGQNYPDDLATDGLIYHYPKTNSKGHDESEISATKESSDLFMPIFVITESESGLRDVYLATVVDWDDLSEQFLIQFSEVPASNARHRTQHMEEPFEAFKTHDKATRKVAARPEQTSFKFDVIKRYGPQCAFCGVSVKEVLDAAHIIARSDNGTDDPRNGIVLCATHHRALDAGIIGIDPKSLEICIKEPFSFEHLQVRYPSIAHLSNKPAKAALHWLWEKRFKGS